MARRVRTSPLTETGAVKVTVRRLKARRLRAGGIWPQGCDKSYGRGGSGRSINIGDVAADVIIRSLQGRPGFGWPYPLVTRKRLKKRVGKKLRQPHRRKDRGPRRRRGAGKNEVLPHRGARR